MCCGHLFLFFPCACHPPVATKKTKKVDYYTVQLLYYIMLLVTINLSPLLLCSVVVVHRNCILVLLLHYHFLWCAVVLIEGSSIFVHINRTHFAYFLLIGRVGMINRLWKLLWLLLLLFFLYSYYLLS